MSRVRFPVRTASLFFFTPWFCAFSVGNASQFCIGDVLVTTIVLWKNDPLLQ